MLSSCPYKDLKLALKFEGRDDQLQRTHCVEFGQRFGVPSPAIEARLDRLTATAALFGPRLKELGYDARLTTQLTELMTQRLLDLK